ncbi:MAG: hypothetical protein WAP58_04940, partial [Peptococcia bacterium]
EVTKLKLTKWDMTRRRNNARKYGDTVREIDDEYYCIPISIKNNEVTIFCPYCMELHRHGKGFGKRVAHCRDSDVENEAGYTIVQSF